MLGKSICMYYLYKIKSGLNNEDTSSTVDLHIAESISDRQHLKLSYCIDNKISSSIIFI